MFDDSSVYIRGKGIFMPESTFGVADSLTVFASTAHRVQSHASLKQQSVRTVAIPNSGSCTVVCRTRKNTHSLIGFRRDQKIEIKRREVELDPQVSPEEIRSREVELGCESWTSFASSCSSTAVQRALSL